ncbi:sensor domain-containing diguanylate cyclase [Christensenella timonensis]|uniref:sensor domain-containing diguanylate cyclase n=1 Tax=Christensenella timonensis TaxID=1816678 RepID=UPI0008329F45|nr:sensor domain-containing diguanylate cyclase [Christensenella timonensis]
MKERILLKTNLLVCLVIVAGFLMTAVLSYRANYSASIENIEQVSALTSEDIYYQINSILTKPVNISLTMANDSLLKDFLIGENSHLDDQEYTQTLQEYLNTYKEKYQYDSVFLVSAATSRYYNFNGLDRVLEQGDPENFWYYDGMLKSAEECSMNVDNDEVDGAQNAITVFVNCKIKDDGGSLLGVVGVGVRLTTLQDILQTYQDDFNMSAYLIDSTGIIEVSPDYSGYEQVNLFEIGCDEQGQKQQILSWKEEGSALSFWNSGQGGQEQEYIVARYLPELQWHLVVERDTGALIESLNKQLAITVAIIIVILALILLLITRVIRRFNMRVVQLAKSVEQERQSIFEKATGQLFEDIYELDITHNRPANRATEEYFEKLGAPPGTFYDKALRIIAEKQIKEEFRQGYIDTFLPEKVLQAYEQGKESLQYEFQITRDGKHYYWMRITARLVKWESDQTLHMLVYRQNIDAEKRQEQKMLQLAQTDEMTGLLTKTATQRRIERMLADEPGESFAFFIFDIDHFKQANDLYGHIYGDSVIQAFAKTLQEHFRNGDIVGRIGGDEFAAFMQIREYAFVEKKARELCAALSHTHTWNGTGWHVSASIGIALAPRDGADFDTLYRHADTALYETKKRSRGGFTLYHDDMEEGKH